MTAEGLALIAGTVLSLLFSYIPGLNDKFAELDATKKRLIMLSLLVVAAVVIYGMSCLGWALGGYQVTCDQVGLSALVEVLIIAIIANQGIFLASPETKRVREAKA